MSIFFGEIGTEIAGMEEGKGPVNLRPCKEPHSWICFNGKSSSLARKPPLSKKEYKRAEPHGF